MSDAPTPDALAAEWLIRWLSQDEKREVRVHMDARGRCVVELHTPPVKRGSAEPAEALRFAVETLRASYAE